MHDYIYNLQIQHQCNSKVNRLNTYTKMYIHMSCAIAHLSMYMETKDLDLVRRWHAIKTNELQNKQWVSAIRIYNITYTNIRIHYLLKFYNFFKFFHVYP